jgi:F0F1-type ATP synthase assembly protein I
VAGTDSCDLGDAPPIDRPSGTNQPILVPDRPIYRPVGHDLGARLYSGSSDRCESNRMTQLTPADLVRILGHVTLILVVPMVGGVVLGLALDAMLDTSPLLVFGGLAIGSLAAAVGVWLYIRAHSFERPDAPDERADER